MTGSDNRDELDDEDIAKPQLKSPTKRRLLGFAKWTGAFAAAAIVGLVIKSFEVPETNILWVALFATFAVLGSQIEDLKFELSSLRTDHDDLQKLHWDYLKNIHRHLHKLDPQF
ncbi:MAG: hypothetical protein SGI91_08405 [Alphaproteobacteria bacterium]|nr:hypothetical protein [Alphaproteobacteria bacterium]